MRSLPSRNQTLEIADKKTRKSRYQTVIVLSNYTGFLYLAPNTLSRIEGNANMFKGLKTNVFRGCKPTSKCG